MIQENVPPTSCFVCSCECSGARGEYEQNQNFCMWQNRKHNPVVQDCNYKRVHLGLVLFLLCQCFAFCSRVQLLTWQLFFFSAIKMGIGKPQSVVRSLGDRSGDLYVLSGTGLERWQVGNGAGCGVVGAQRELRVFCFSNWKAVGGWGTNGRNVLS